MSYTNGLRWYLEEGMSFPHPKRRRYHSLLAKPAWGLYRGTKLVGAIRADNAEDARQAFGSMAHKGDTIERLPRDKT